MTNDSLTSNLEHRINRLEEQVQALQEAAGLAPIHATLDALPPDPAEPAGGREKSEGADSSTPESLQAVPSIRDWFGGRGFSVTLGEESPADKVFDRLAEYLGDHFAHLERFTRQLRWTLREGKTTSLGLQKCAPAEREDCLKFARMLNDRALLSHHNYNQDARRLSFRAKTDQRFEQFLNGFWLERYVLVKGRQCVGRRTSRFASARNLEVVNSDKTRFEMDVMFLVGDDPIWIECKSREFRRDIDRYANRAKTLSIPLDRTLLVVQSFDLEDPEEVTQDLSAMFGLTVIPTTHLTEKLDQILEQQFGSGAAAVDEAHEGDALETELTEFFREVQLAPYPEERQEVLAVLLDAVSTGMPASLGELRERMRASLPRELQAAAHPVLMAVRRGGGAVGMDGKPYKGMALATEISALAVGDVPGLEAICLSGYEDAVKRKMPDVLERDDFESIFQKVVGDGAGRATPS